MSRSKQLKPTHPGEVLGEDVLPVMGKGKAEIARMLGVSRQTLYDILNEVKPVTPQMALRIGKLLGNGPEIWLRMRVNYDLAIQAVALAGEIGKIPTLKAA